MQGLLQKNKDIPPKSTLKKTLSEPLTIVEKKNKDGWEDDENLDIDLKTLEKVSDNDPKKKIKEMKKKL